jgi:hypothetical protein
MLTFEDREHIHTLNTKNGWGFTQAGLRTIIQNHKKARKTGDNHAMEMIEYRLTDCNFHHECGCLMAGKYDKAMETVKSW